MEEKNKEIVGPLMYGVWIKGQGWLRGKDIFADFDKDKALEVAKITGGVVRYIDQSIIDLESIYIEAERKKIKWDTLINFFRHKIYTSNNK